MPVFSASGTVRAPTMVGRPGFGGLLPRQKLPLWLNKHESSRILLSSQSLKWYGPAPMFLTVNNKKPNVDNTSGTIEPARVLLERLFLQTQRLEEKMNKDSSLIQHKDFSTSLEVLESDIRAALLALRKREEDLQNAERKILSDRAEIMRAKQDLEHREIMIVSAITNQEKLEKDLKLANRDLESKAREVGDLRLLVEEQRQKIASSQAALSVKEDELIGLRNELSRKNDQVEGLIQEIESRDKLLIGAKKVIKKQKTQLRAFQVELKKRESELASSLLSKKRDEEKLRASELKLEKMGTQWLLTQKVLKQLADESSKKATEDFKRVRSLLSDLKLEMISSRKSLAATRKALEVQVHQLENKGDELKEESLSLSSYAKKLEGAHLEVERERTELNIVAIQRDKLYAELLSERKHAEKLDEELRTERGRVEEVQSNKDSLQRDLQHKTSAFISLQELLRVRESELEGLKLMIQNLQSEQASIKLLVRKKDQILMENQQKLMDLEGETAELRRIMEVKEDLIMQMTRRLQEKEKRVVAVENELDDTKLQLSNAAANIEQISQLTNKLVDSLSKQVSLEMRDEGIQEMGDLQSEIVEKIIVDDDSECQMRKGSGRIHEVEKELTNLLSLTNKLLKDAGISC